MRFEILVVVALIGILWLLYQIEERLREVATRLQPKVRPLDDDDPIKLIRGDTYNMSQHITAIRQKITPLP